MVRGDTLSVYNNLFMGGAGSVLNNGAVMDKFGFNLTYNSPYEGFLTPATDIVSPLPPIVSLFPTTVAAVALRPDSRALDAGTSNGIDPDYITDIGAVEMGYLVDTAVPPRTWELYR